MADCGVCCVLEFNAVAVQLKGTVGNGGIGAGVGWCAEQDDAFVVAVRELAVGDGVL